MSDMRTHWLIALALTFTAAWLTGCGDSDTQRFIIASGGQSGVYHPTATKIAELTKRADGNILIDNQTSGGSVENARRLQNGDADFAMIQNNIAAYARAGSAMFAKDGKMPEIRGVAALYPEHIQVVARADSGIERITDLKGKAVAIGDIGSGTAADARNILEAHGMSEDDLGQKQHLTASESASYLQDGRIDAAFFTFGVGTSDIRSLANTTSVRFVPIEGEARRTLIDAYPFYSEAIIPAGAYRGADQPAGALPPTDVPTVSVTATLVAHEDVPADVVESVLRGMFDNLPELHAQHARLRVVNKADARNNLSMPLHAGAEAFYEESGSSSD